MDTMTETVATYREELPAPPEAIFVPKLAQKAKAQKTSAPKPPPAGLFAPIMAEVCGVQCRQNDADGIDMTVVSADHTLRVRYSGLHDRTISNKLAHKKSARLDVRDMDFPIPEGLAWQALEAAPFVAALEYLSQAMSNDATRYNLNGVFFGAEGSTYAGEACATDGHRLHCVKGMPSFGANGTHQQEGVSVTAVAVKTILAAIKWTKSEGVTVARQGDQLFWLIGSEGRHVELATRLVDGQFPDYHQVFPLTDGVPRYSASVRDIQAALKYAPRSGTDRAASYRIAFGETVSVNIPKIDIYPLPLRCHEKAPKTVEMSAFNARYFSEAFDGLEGSASVYYCGDLTPLVVAGTVAGKDTSSVIMPMRA